MNCMAIRERFRQLDGELQVCKEREERLGKLLHIAQGAVEDASDGGADLSIIQGLAERLRGAERAYQAVSCELAAHHRLRGDLLRALALFDEACTTTTR